ncbi:MAG: polysaccharide biosynthesis tyrosine autokinase [Deltaproteobacteria bacterium]|nr:polysaccharide biosynthesis tyrosine autokinase [Deltaproteobacteria bacterium]
MSTQLQDQGRESGLGVQPSEILRAITHRKWLILASTVVVGAAVGTGSMRQKKVYSAAASVMIEPIMPKVIDNPVGFEGISELSRAEALFSNTQYRIIRSRPVLLSAAATLGLEKNARFLADYGINPQDHADVLDAAAGVLERQLEVVPQRGSRIVRLIVEDYDPNRAAEIANGVAQAYKTHALDRRLGATLEAHRWLDQQVAEFSKALEASEAKLAEFRRANQISVNDRKNMNSAKLARLNEELVDVRTSLIRLRAKRKILQAELAQKDGTQASVPEIASNPVIAGLRGKLVDLASQRAQIASRYGPKHDTMKAIDDQIGEVRRLIEAELSIVVETNDNEIKALESTEAGINAALDVERTAARELEELVAEYNTLAADNETTKTRLAALQKRQTDADLSGRLKSNFVEIFENAEPNPAPIRPSIVKNSALGLLAGLALGLMIAIASVMLDTTVRSQADIEELLGLTFLGIVPSIHEKAETAGETQLTRDLYLVRSPKSSLAECLRSIRTNILFMGTDKPLKKILVTSPGPSEGKSTVATNLALVMAQAGQRVLLVDTDLRRPRLHRVFSVSSETGVTTVLLKAASVEEVIRPTGVVGMDILPCGPLPPNPAELLHSSHFTELVETLCSMYDRVIFDSPPVNAVTDSVILSQIVDGTLLVAKVGTTAKDGVRRARRQLGSVNASLLGCVLNDIDLEHGSYGYSHYYYYSHRYGYGAEEKSAET